MDFDPAVALEDAFKAHGVLTNRIAQGVSIDEANLVVSAGVVRVDNHPNARVVQLDVRAYSQRLANKVLIESFGGVGADESKATEQAFGKFLRSSIHVLLATLVEAKYGNDQVEWESWNLDDKRWRVCMGPLLHQGSASVHIAYAKLLERLKSELLPGLGAGFHWLRVYCMLNGTSCVGSEALLDNMDWPEGRRIVSEWRWPEGTLWARHFLMLVPGRTAA